MWALGFEPRFSRPQREVLTTIRCPHTCQVWKAYSIKMASHMKYTPIFQENRYMEKCNFRMKKSKKREKYR